MLQVKNIKKEYHTGSLVQKALDDVSLNLRDNEFVAILGPSGSGKTTLLNIIGGLDQYDSGDLVINGISTKEYTDRDWDSYRNHTVGFVFQSYNLIPHQTLLSNVELALTISGVGKAERRRRAKEALEKVGLGDQVEKKPAQLSGGQMQRVAIARALVNDPDILLADEPTGALDSVTSVQVMDLLQEVARDRLVVMVTHNPDLAEAYATRIVQLSDGKIRSDTNPFFIDEKAAPPPVHQNMGKSSMNFRTALSLSFNNLRTKKARTILTAFAGSIGIIGIALILSLSTGVNNYIASIEEDTLIGYPLSISNTGFDWTSLLVSTSSDDDDEEEEGEINVAGMITSMFSTMEANDLATLKEYLDSGESGIEEYINAIEYSYDIVPQIYRTDGDTIRQVNPDSTFSSLGFGSTSSASSLISSMMSTDVFYQLPETESLYMNDYEVKAGRWPESYDEVVLVLNSDGSISDFLLYTLGLRDAVELDEMIQKFIDGENIETPDNSDSYTYDDMLGITFKLVSVSDYYEYDSEYGVWTDKSGNSEYMKELVNNGEDITIVGIVQAVEDAGSSILSSGIYYSYELIEHVAEMAAESEIVQEQLANPDVNVFTGEAFGEESTESDLDLESLISIDEDAMADAFNIDTEVMEDALALDSDSLGMDSLDTDSMQETFLGAMDLDSMNLSDSIDLSDVSVSLSDMGDVDLSGLIGSIAIDTSAVDMNALVTSLMEGYEAYVLESTGMSTSSITDNFTEYLASDSAQEIISETVMEVIAESGGVTVTTDDVNDLMTDLMTGYMSYLTAQGISLEELLADTGVSTENASEAASAAQSALEEAASEAASTAQSALESASTEVTSESVSEAASAAQSALEEAASEVASAAQSALEAASEAAASQSTQDSTESDSSTSDSSTSGSTESDSSTTTTNFATYLTEYLQTSEAQTLMQAWINRNLQLDGDMNLTTDQAQKLAESLVAGYEKYAAEKGYLSTSDITKTFEEYMATDSANAILTEAAMSMIDTDAVSEQVSAAMETYMSSMMSSYGEAISESLESQMSDVMSQVMEQVMDQMTEEMEAAMVEMVNGLGSSLQDAISIDADAFLEAFDFTMDSEYLTELLMSISSSTSASYESNLETLGYADFSTPTEIDIYSKDFDCKEEVVAILDNYNAKLEEEGNAEQVITYTDTVGTLMSSVTEIVDMVSYVLIAFVAISLVVSSIMIGVITYISVLERRKEIGILRAIGASKGNISQVFNAETGIIGFTAGLLGIVLALLLTIPGNALIHYFGGTDDVNMVLMPQYAIALICLSICLTLIGGLIPSGAAAKSDPVAALRSE